MIQGRSPSSQARVAERAPLPPLDDPSLFLNRELSWLEFNRRVLAQATDSNVPLLERVRFVSIFHSNLDEFFQVRVSGLQRQVAAGVTKRTADGRTPAEQLAAIEQRLRPMLEGAQETFHDQLLPLLARHGIALPSVRDLTTEEEAYIDAYFDQQVFPVLTPLAVDPGHPFPYISNLSLSLAVAVADHKTGEEHFARVKVPEVLPRFVPLPGGHRFVALEELINSRLERLFPGMTVNEAFSFRVTRNADVSLEEDEADDLLMAMEQELRRRRFGAVARLEVSINMSARTMQLLQDELDVSGDATYRVSGLLGGADLNELANLDLPNLRYPPFTPEPDPRFVTPADIFAQIREQEILVHHPYDSFTHTVERFITAAVDDPQVLAIKQTLYRTSGDSPIVRALIRAAEKGKQVVALVEVKARFDEQANITWARALEKAGVHVVYGLVGLKTHSKLSLVVRREGGELRRYAHIGTGNYNPKTAKLYTDLGLFTCAPDIGADLTDLFNYLTGYARHERYRTLLVAPLTLREQVGALIQREIDLHSEERPGLIRAKLNSLVDDQIITDLYRASQAGVQVELLIRGICGVRPGVPGISDRIRVVSIIGRFLEHTRILQFGPEDLWIGSADWMPRNLDRRVEAMVPVRDAGLKRELTDTFDLMMQDNILSWSLAADGRWTRRFPADGEDPLNSQDALLEHARIRRHQVAASSEPG